MQQDRLEQKSNSGSCVGGRELFLETVTAVSRIEILEEFSNSMGRWQNKLDNPKICWRIRVV